MENTDTHTPLEGSPDHGTSYYKAVWGSYKGHIRGVIRGLMLGALLGTIIGATFLAVASPLGLVALSTSAFATIGTFTALGSILGSQIMGHIGSAAGNVATHKALEEINLRYPSLPMIAPDSPEPGHGHHHEVPADRDRGKIFRGRVGLLGIVLGGAVGSLLGLGSMGETLAGHSHGMFTELASALPAGLNAAIAVPASIGASLGAFFGIERSVFKSIFNFTDNLFMGRIGGPSEQQLSKGRERFRAANPMVTSEITSLERQEEFYRLQDGYYTEAFAAGFSGNARGMLGGILGGGLVGVTFGTIIALTVFSGGTAVPIITAFAAIGSSMGFHSFSGSTRESALHSAVDEIFDERIHFMKKGQEISFKDADFIAGAKRRGDPELTPPEAEIGVWFKPKLILIGLAAGAACGILMAPLITAFMGATFSIALTTGGCATLMGAWGASFGFGEKFTRGVQNLSDNLFMGRLFPKEHKRAEDRNSEIPLFESNSSLAILHDADTHSHIKAPAITRDASTIPTVGQATKPIKTTASAQPPQKSAETSAKTKTIDRAEIIEQSAYLRNLLGQKRERASQLFQEQIKTQKAADMTAEPAMVGRP